MFEVLLESKAKKQRTTTQFLTSVVLHGVLIFVAVQATKGAAEQVREILQDTTLVFLEPPKAAPEPEKPPPDVVLSANPPPQGFQTVVAVQDIPTEIPPVNLNERFNPSDFTGKGVEGGIAAGVVGGTGPVPITGETFLEAQVDDPPQLISAGPQRYPPVLRSAGVTGRVMASSSWTPRATPKRTRSASSRRPTRRSRNPRGRRSSSPSSDRGGCAGRRSASLCSRLSRST